MSFLKNGSCFKNTSIYIPAVDRIFLSSTCSASAVLYILTICASDFISYFHYLSNVITLKNEASYKNYQEYLKKEIYKNRVQLLMKHYFHNKID